MNELSVIQAAFDAALDPDPHSPEGQRADPPELFGEATSLLGLPPDVLAAFFTAQRKAVAELNQADAKRVR